MVQLVIHCDFHPGNLKYDGDQVVGLFDFDWSKMDARSFDVALALWYFCTGWSGGGDGILRLGQVETFLRAYQGWLGGRFGLGPLDPVEGKYLPYMINASNLYVLNWTILDYYGKDVDPQEYMIYLQHHVRFLHWFEDRDNFAQLEKIARDLSGSRD
jgi:homoserine kinase type II